MTAPTELPPLPELLSRMAALDPTFRPFGFRDRDIATLAHKAMSAALAAAGQREAPAGWRNVCLQALAAMENVHSTCRTPSEREAIQSLRDLLAASPAPQALSHANPAESESQGAAGITGESVCAEFEPASKVQGAAKLEAAAPSAAQPVAQEQPLYAAAPRADGAGVLNASLRRDQQREQPREQA